MGCHFGSVSGMNCLIFQLFADVFDSEINAYIFQEKFCMQSFDRICLKEKY